MKKLTLLVSAMGFFALGTQAICMEKVRTLQCGNAVVLKNPYHKPTAEQLDALQLLNQHYRYAQQTNTYLPELFFTELDKYYQQVDPTNLKLRRKFGNLRIVTQSLREPERTTIPAHEVFDAESLTSSSDT